VRMNTDDATIFESHRATLLALAYRMVGDLARAEDMVQDAWVRWHRRDVVAESPKAFLIKIVTRLCLNELGSARSRREESRSDRLPEPVELKLSGHDRADRLERVSMAFMVVLQRLTPAERAALLLHEVFDFDHRAIASLLDKTEAASRQLLRRARKNMASTRRTLTASRAEHLKLLRAFVEASNSGKVEALAGLLAEDAVLMSDGGPEGVRVGNVRNIPVPVRGRPKIAAVVTAINRRSPAGLERRETVLNGQPAIVGLLDGRPVFAVLLAVADGKIQHIFIHADPTRLSHLGPLN